MNEEEVPDGHLVLAVMDHRRKPITMSCNAFVYAVVDRLGDGEISVNANAIDGAIDQEASLAVLVAAIGTISHLVSLRSDNDSVIRAVERFRAELAEAGLVARHPDGDEPGAH